ncbi:autophagy-type protein 22 [Hysterangium stoloniferum]|nr:autophagy-type protein 22 [Hysterangium stoloniferum]
MTETLISEDRATARHLRGWLAYAFASEVFAVVGLSVFLPICLEQFARDNGYLLPDKTVRCTSAAGLVAAADELRCAVKIGWVWIDTASFSLYVFSTSVALQALTVISMGGIADHPPHRKPLLLFFAYLGSTCAILFFVISSSSPVWPVVGLLACGANVGFGASLVAMNSYLPSLARESKEVRKAWDALQHHRQQADVDGGITITTATPEEAYHAAISRSTSKISAFGIALGYIAGIVLLFCTVVPVAKLHSSTFALRLAIGMSGVWWAVISIPAGLWLPSGSALKIVEGADLQVHDGAPWSFRREVLAAWARLGQMLRWREIKRLRNTFWYLSAWFLLSDGFSTITSTAVLFGKTAIHMPSSELILVGALAPIGGIVGSLVWPVVQRWIGWSDLRMIKLFVVLVSFIPLYGCLGFLPIFRDGHLPFGGLTTPGEMYGLAFIFGLMYGAFQSYSRSLFSFLIPPGEESRWYGLYSITDKSSSFIGPLIVGLISDVTGSIRNAFFFLTVLMWISLPLLSHVDVLRGKEDAISYIEERQTGLRREGEYVEIPVEDGEESL